jgi:hypothetical protein
VVLCPCRSPHLRAEGRWLRPFPSYSLSKLTKGKELQHAYGKDYTAPDAQPGRAGLPQALTRSGSYGVDGGQSLLVWFLYVCVCVSSALGAYKLVVHCAGCRFLTQPKLLERMRRCQEVRDRSAPASLTQISLT